jgi:hypothetical protein
LDVVVPYAFIGRLFSLLVLSFCAKCKMALVVPWEPENSMPVFWMKRQKKVNIFEHVAGIEEVKEDLDEIVEFLRNPPKFLKFGKISKGVLIGPPAPENPFWIVQLLVRPMFHSFPFLDQTLWKFLSVWVPAVYGICLNRRNKPLLALFLTTLVGTKGLV